MAVLNDSGTSWTQASRRYIYQAIADIARGFDLSCIMFASGRGLPLIMAVDERGFCVPFHSSIIGKHNGFSGWHSGQ